MQEIGQKTESKALLEIQSAGKITSFNGAEANRVYKHLESKGLIIEQGKGWRVIGKTNDQAETGESTTEDLRRDLLTTIKDLREGNIDVKRAKTVADLAGKVIDTAKLELAHNIATEKLNKDLSAPVRLLDGN